MAIRYERLGDAPRYRDIMIADTEAELLASTPPVEIAEGYAKDTGIKADWMLGAGWKIGGATKSATGLVFSDAVQAPNSISSFLPGQTAGVPDTAALTVNAGISQRVALPTGDAFKIDFSGFGPFAMRFGDSSVAAVATDFPGIVGQPLFYRKPVGATHLAVYGIGAGSLVVSGGTTP